MTDIKGYRVVLNSRPIGAPIQANFRLEEDAVTKPADGEVLLATKFLSLDPYVRGRMHDAKSYAEPTPIGGVLEGEVVAEVIESRDSAFAPGDMVTAHIGWRTHALVAGSTLTKLENSSNPVSASLGVLGMPGLTAYAGLLNIGQPKPGETVVVAAATGPVGSLVGQIAKIKGARVVGIAGGPEKCAFLIDELGFDVAVDHRSPTFHEDLAAACPDGIDVYFELVGGAVWQAVLPLLNEFARVPVCGLTAEYNRTSIDGPDLLPGTMMKVLTGSVTMRGFIIREFWGQREQFLQEVGAWIAEGRVKFREDIVVGLENAPQAFIGMLEGKNFGKLLVNVSKSDA